MPWLETDVRDQRIQFVVTARVGALRQAYGWGGKKLACLLAAEGRLAGPFPHSAAWGDIITGVAAVPLLWLTTTTGTRHKAAIAAWDLFGAADLVIAIALGMVSAAGSPLQIFHAGPGSEAMQYLPWSFVPTVMVPFWLILHAIIWAQLRRPATKAA